MTNFQDRDLVRFSLRLEPSILTIE